MTVAPAPTASPARLGLAVAAKAPCDPAPFLDALRADPGFADAGVEIHVAHDGDWPAAVALTPAVKVHAHACPPGSSAFRLWGVAVARAAAAAADYVAILDAQAPPGAGWLARARAEIARGTPLFFGSVEPGWGMRDRRIVGYLAEYAQFRAPIPHALAEVPGNNLVGRIDLFAGAGDAAADGFVKTLMLRRLARDGGPSPRPLDDMPVVYRKGFAPAPYLAARVAQGRAFAARRHDDPGQPGRLLCAAFTPALPLLRLWRIRRAVRRDRMLHRAALRHLPFLLLSEVAWSLGELSGYLARGSRDGRCGTR